MINNVNTYKSVNIYGTNYQIGTFLALHEEDLQLQFGEIIDIINLDNQIFFYIKVYDEMFFDEHYHVYVVEEKNENRLVEFKTLPVIMPVSSIKKN